MPLHVSVKIWLSSEGTTTCCGNYCYINHSTVKPRFTNASDHEHFGLRTNFPNTKRLGWLLCLELRTLKRSTSWSDKLGVSASTVFVEEWSSGKIPRVSNTDQRERQLLSTFDLLSVVFIFFVIDLMVSIDFLLRTCAQSTVVKV
jgi:hypothetical protein